jgi:hypothetical protein
LRRLAKTAKKHSLRVCLAAYGNDFAIVIIRGGSGAIGWLLGRGYDGVVCCGVVLLVRGRK